MLFRNFEDLNATWCIVRGEVISGRLGANGALCNTLMYNPLFCGAGPKTTGRITVFTNEDDVMEVGMKLIKLSVVQHDIQYKTQEDTRAGKFAHTAPGEKIAKLTLYWNSGNPSAELTGCKCPAKVRDDKHSYDPSTDRWKINVVNGAPHYSSDCIHGKWVITTNYDPSSKVNIKELWHNFKPNIEEGEIPAIMMECPAPKKQQPEIHIFTSKGNMTKVGESLIYLLKRDITYMVGGGSFRNDLKTLYWNDGNPGYERGSQKSWRQH